MVYRVLSLELWADLDAFLPLIREVRNSEMVICFVYNYDTVTEMRVKHASYIDFFQANMHSD